MAELIEMEDFVTEACERIAARIIYKQAEKGVCCLGLCGGSTPKPIYSALAEWTDIDWQRVLITFGDERCVHPEDRQSNYRMVKRSLLRPAGIPESNVIRMEGELEPVKAAKKCEQRLRELAGECGEDVFKHDLILLGMGEDGHTASLFPESEALNESERWVKENFIASQDSWRLTMTYPLINAADEVMFLITGDKKKAIAEQILAGEVKYPAAHVTPKSDQLTWIVG